MVNRQGGKAKPLKKPKKAKRVEDDEDIALKKKLRDEQKQLKQLQARAKSSKGMLSGGIKKSKSGKK